MFLQEVAQKIQARQEGDFSQTLILTPNRRAGLFLQREIQSLNSEPIWSPIMMTLDEWIKYQVEEVEADRLSVIYKLYEFWNQALDQKETFENFYFFGQRLLDDFDQLDKYRIDADRLFTNLADEKDIDALFSDWKQELIDHLRQFWSSVQTVQQNQGESEQQIENFTFLWRRLGEMKRSLDERLLAEKKAYSGQMYRQLSDHLSRLDDWRDYDIYFVGFNRLNRSEQKVMRYCVSQYGAQVFWNYDKNLLEEGTYNNAGRFIRGEHLYSDGNHHNICSDWMNSPKEVELFGVQKKAAQAQWVARILEKSDVSADRIAIILPDESLLLPILSSLPKRISDVNISMGVSLKETPILSLLQQYLTMHQRRISDTDWFLSEDVQRVLEHPYVESDQISSLSLDQYTISSAALIAALEPMHKHWFAPIEHDRPEELFDHFLQGLEALYQYQQEQSAGAEGLSQYISEIIVFAGQRLRRLRDIYREERIELSFDALHVLIDHYFRHARIPFKGVPLRGLQILGPLEARNLDFDHVIIPQMNEGSFPGSPSQSLIPYHLQKAFRIPVPEEALAEEAYYFYMAIARASKVSLLYNELTGDLGAKELSRFAQSIRLFLPPSWTLKEKKHLQSNQSTFQDPVIIEKTPEIRSAILADLKRGLSPSKLQTYLDCSLKYYLKYIEGRRTETTTDRKYSGLTLGRVLHKTMENLYEKGRNYTPEDIDNLMEKAESMVQEIMEKSLKIHPKFQSRGELLLIRNYIIDRVRHILEYDKKWAPFTMVQHEFDVGDYSDSSIPIRGVEGLNSIRFKGIIDRVDKKGSLLRLSDYKTGVISLRSNRPSSEIADWEDMMASEQKQYHSLAIQLGLYGWVVGRLKPSSLGSFQDIQLGNYTVQEMSNPAEYDHRFRKGRKVLESLDADDYHSIEAGLTQVFREMLDPERAFYQTDDTSKCNFCPFNQFCKRTDPAFFG